MPKTPPDPCSQNCIVAFHKSPEQHISGIQDPFSQSILQKGSKMLLLVWIWNYLNESVDLNQA